MKRKLAWLVALSLVACAGPPRPRVLTQVDAARESSSVQRAKELAPQQYAHAENLRREAEAAHDRAEHAKAQVLGEHALAAYERAVALSRIVSARQRLASADARLAQVNLELAELDAEQQKLATEAETLEMRLNVVRDSLPIVPSGPATAERERARHQAARAIVTEARLLCSAARLLDSQAPGLGERMQEIEAFERNTPAGGGQAIDAARSARSGCLKVLTHLRRPKTAEAQAAGAAEALLEQVGRRGTLLPVRDDRGVVVTLRDMFQQNTKFAQQATEVIGFLAGVARENPSFPVLVVAHEPRASKLAAERAQAVASALEKAGAPSVAFESARADQPVVDPRKPGAAQKNARIEVVFVAPAH